MYITRDNTTLFIVMVCEGQCLQRWWDVANSSYAKEYLSGRQLHNSMYLSYDI